MKRIILFFVCIISLLIFNSCTPQTIEDPNNYWSHHHFNHQGTPPDGD